MKSTGYSLEQILGVNIRARHKREEEHFDRYFQNPIVHKQIKGDKIYVPIDLNRVWKGE
ncbi:hypothetical protein [Bacillus sp. CECT 9360]|uniref:hypothetical protein n=1 Tax=Bacillus sp. CECT 9360 TaxID=2845821 RepID=UPI001E4FF87C|nr:hypothetical protein [Bacillus sp. CECT 9360]CAH0344136.1 hypothetical protein BCI9360_00367 [Bacillus sp. CECT 9360]